MKAAVFEGPGNMVVRDVDDPRCERDGIVVRVKACGICGSDVRNYRTGLRTGRPSAVQFGGVPPKGSADLAVPGYGKTGQIIGHEIAGIVERVGSDCRLFSPGEELAIAPDVSCGACPYCRRGLVNLCLDHRMVGTHWPGGFAQFLGLPRVVLERGMVHRIPPGVSFRHAALAEPLSSVLAAQETAGIGPGQAVAVFGAGTIGCLHVQVARDRGAFPVVLVGRRRLTLAAAFRPDVAVRVGEEDPVAAVLASTEGLGADVAIIAAPSAECQEQGIESVRKRGTVILFGGLPRENPFARLDANRIHYNELRVLGSFSYPAEKHLAALETIRAGRIAADSLISRVVSLEGITDAFLAAERGEVLKVIVDPWV